MKTIEKEDVEISIKYIFSIILNNIIFITLSFILILAAGLYYIKSTKPKFTSEVIFEVVSDQERGSSFNNLPGALSLILPSSRSSGEVIPIIMGLEFLSNLSKEKDVEEMLAPYCKYGQPSIFSLRGFLNHFNILTIPKPTDAQLDSLKAGCIAGAIDIKEYDYEGLKTNAYKLEVEHIDREFATFLANKTVDVFFREQEFKAIDRQKRTIEVISDSLAEAKEKTLVSQSSLKSFLLENSIEVDMFSLDNLTGNASSIVGAFSDNSFTKLYKLRALQERRIEIEKAVTLLSNSLKREVLRTGLLESMRNFKELSNEFLYQYNSINKKSSASDKPSLLRALVQKELKRLNFALENVLLGLSKAEMSADNALRIEEKVKSLGFEFRKNKIYEENFEKLLQQKIIESNLFFNKNRLHSRAKTPNYPSSPNAKLIVLFSTALGIIFPLIIVMILQGSRKRLLLIDQISDDALKGKSFISNLKDLGFKDFASISTRELGAKSDIVKIARNCNEHKKIAIIGVGKTSPLAKQALDKVCLYFGILFGGKEEKVLNRIYSDKFLSKSLAFGHQKNVINLERNSHKLLNNGIAFCLVNESEHKDNFKDVDQNYDKVITMVSTKTLYSDKINAIEHSDQFVLVGLKGRVSIKEIDSLLSVYEKSRDKCAGFVMVGL